MKTKCRNRLECLSCSRCLPTVLRDPTILPKKSSNNTKEHNCTLTTFRYKSTNCQTYYKEPKHGACYDTVADGQTCAMAIIPVKIKLKDKNTCVITYALFDTAKI